jgi:hypothetical protein
MAFGLKYELHCTTRKNRLFKTRVYFDGYAGSQINRNVPISPFKLRKDKAAVIRGTSFEFSIREQVDFEFLEFYTNSNKKIKVELYDPSNSLIWVGFNLPQQYQVPYTAPPVSVTFTASDGLGLLKSEAFTLTGRASQLDIIRHCIDKIGLGIGYSIAINTFEVTHNHSYSPLAQTFEDSDSFSGMKCYEVIEKILNKYDAEITQSRGKWQITCSADKKSTRMLYTSAGVYSSTEAAPAVLDLGLPGSGIEASPRGALRMGLEPGGKQVRITHAYGRKTSLLNNPDFSKFASGSFDGWSEGGTFTPEQRFNDEGAYAFIPSFPGFNLYQSVTLDAVSGEDFNFSIKMGAIASKPYGGIPISIPITAKLLISLTSGGTVNYLTESGWTATLTYITKAIASQIGGIPKMNQLTIIADGLPFSGVLQIKLYGIDQTNHGETFGGIAYSNVDLFFTSDGQLYPAGIEKLAKFTDSQEPTDLADINLLNADAPDLPNAWLLYKYITWLSSNGVEDITTFWHRDSGNHTLIEILALILASNNRVARQKLTGDIKGTAISFDSIILHTYNSAREFEIAEGTWDIYNETFNVTLVELLSWSDETVEIIDTSLTNNPSSGGSQAPGSGSGSSYALTNADILKYFELVVNDGLDEYIRCKLPFAGDYDIAAYLDFGQFPASIWADMPHASATVLGGIKVGTNLTIDVNGVLNASGGSGGDGVWGSITGTIGDQTDLQTALGTKLNSSAYSASDVLAKLLTVDGTTSGLDADLLDGNHASAFATSGHNHSGTYDPAGTGHTEAAAHVATHEGAYSHGNIAHGETAYGWGNHASVGYLTAQISHNDVVVDSDFSSNGILKRTSAGVYGIVTDNSGNWNTAYGWGNHASGGYAPTADPVFTGYVTIATGVKGNSTNVYLYLYPDYESSAYLLIDDAPKFCFMNGNVGIGTATPMHELDVVGTIVSSGDIIAYHS